MDYHVSSIDARKHSLFVHGLRVSETGGFVVVVVPFSSYVEEYRDDEIEVMGHLMSLGMAPFDRSHTSSYSSSVVTMVISCIVPKIKRDIGRKSPFFILPFYTAIV